ncbi:MAG: PLP-dependent aminotransferase family protein [Planctomycetaceae bacterium]|nr:PLP-dependent aminotransferase family protein [Planctomycetaceae bacterium]
MKSVMLGITVERDSDITLVRQIREQIADLILTGHLHAGDALPSTRGLAISIGVSRNTVNDAYEMLWTEGYIVSRQGSGFTVLENIALERMSPPTQISLKPNAPLALRYDFRTGIPDLTHFPFSKWNRVQREVLETVKPGDMLYGSMQGYAPLRTAIADWLLRSRGIRANGDSIFITSGATQAIGLAVETLCRRMRTIAVENPSHLAVTRFMQLRNITFTPCAVDAGGLRVDLIDRQALAGVYVTPSHQFPLGCVLSASRRAHLVAMARENDWYIIEDDYDSEYRFGGQALTPLYGLDPERVVYIGTFSKTLFPALRIGFAIVPKALQHSWCELRRYTDVQNPIVEQVTLCRFLEQRRMDRHIKTMTGIYGRKRKAVVASIAGVFGDHVEIMGDSAGLHLALRLPGNRFGKDFRERCLDNSLAVMPCSRYVQDGTEYDDTLLIGYGNVEENRIDAGMHLLAEMVESARTGT